jgi:hypothetical protein
MHANLPQHEHLLARLIVLFQNTPLRLGQAKGERDYVDILQELTESARTHQLHQWLDWVSADQHEYRSSTNRFTHRILYVLLVELRTYASETGQVELFNLSDCFITSHCNCSAYPAARGVAGKSSLGYGNEQSFAA